MSYKNIFRNFLALNILFAFLKSASAQAYFTFSDVLAESTVSGTPAATPVPPVGAVSTPAAVPAGTSGALPQAGGMEFTIVLLLIGLLFVLLGGYKLRRLI